MLQPVDLYVGPAAGIATSFLWTATSLFFTAASRRLGPTTVNAVRIAMAIVLLGLTHRLLSGQWLPPASTRAVLYLALSGIVGLSVGDQFLFTAFVRIGPRLAMLIMSTAPLFAALFGWLVLDETLGSGAWLGIALTLGGVGWVILERRPQQTQVRSTFRAYGILFALVAAACQAGGLLLSKQGMGHGWLPAEEQLDPQPATLLRMVFAGLGMVPILTLHRLRQRKRRVTSPQPMWTGSRRAGLLYAGGGAVVGPFLGVWMSLVAADRTPLGTAQTLCSLPPVLILPFAALVHKERITMRAVCGAIVAVAGTALLFFNPQ